MNTSEDNKRPAGQGMSPSNQAARRKRFVIIGFTMVVVVIPFALYYLFFVTSQTTYFSKRNFRVLAGIGDNISSKIDNLASNLVNVVKKVECKDTSNTQNVADKQGPRPIADTKKVAEAVKLVPDLKFDADQYEQAKARVEQKANVTTALPRVASPNTASQGEGSQAQGPAAAAAPATESAPLVTMTVKLERGSFWLFPEYRGASSALPGILPVKSELKPLFAPLVERFVIDELNETRERLFDEVLVAEQETGKVIFQRGSPGLTVVTLDSFLNAKGGKLELKLADQSSSLLDVQIAGTDYKLFLQPVRLTLSSFTDPDRQGVRWVVCGLTRTDHFRDETFAVSYTVLIVVVFVVLLAVLSWPLLKLKLMGPKDRMRRFDLGMTLFSALMGTALVTFILLDLNASISINNTRDRQLKDLSKEIQTNFRTELRNALDQLGRMNGRIEDERKKHPRDSGLGSIDSCSFSWSRRMNTLVDQVYWEKETDPDPYPYFNAVTWTDLDGQQQIKWTTQNDTTALINVSGREFFKNAKDHKLWKLGNTNLEYYLEPVRSKNTGENVAVIATSEPGSQWVSNLDTRLLSLMGPVLPAGYGFAVVDNNGKVMFHSDEVKNLEEQFFAECDNNRGLRAAVISRTNEFIDTNYLGKGHHMYVTALAGMPWTLVTFADERIARTMNLEVVTLSFVLYLLYALFIVALVSIVCLSRTIAFSGRYLPRDGDWGVWLWPDSKRALQYELLIVSYVIIACAFVVPWIVGGWVLVICCTVLPLLAAVLWWLILRDQQPAHAKDKIGAIAARLISFYRGRHSWVVTRLGINRVVDKGTWLRRSGLLSYRVRYALSFAGLLGIASVLPAVGFFRIAGDFEMMLMVKHGQVSIAKAREQRDQRIDSQYASTDIGKRKDVFLERRRGPSSINPNLDVYDLFFFGTTDADVSQVPARKASEASGQFDEDSLTKLDRLLQQFRPQYNQSCVESQGLAADASSDELWRWKQDRDGQILLAKDTEGRREEPPVVLKSRIPAIIALNTFPEWFCIVLSFAIVVLLIYALVRFVARHFFLLDLDLPPCIDFPFATTKLEGNRVLVWSPMTANGYKWDPQAHHVDDLDSENDWTAWKKKLMSERSKTGRSVVLNNFEHCMEDPAANREKLLAIEELLQSEVDVVVVSTVDPLSFSIPAKPARQVATNNGDVKAPPSEPVRVAAQQNGASDFTLEYHGSIPVSVAIEGKQHGADDVSQQPPAFCLPRDIQARWTAAFTSFATVFPADTAPDEFVEDRPDFKSMLKTNAPWGYLVAIWKALARTGRLPEQDFDRAKVQELINQVVEQARSYHQSLWDSCSEGQRCTLIQLAQDGMISPKNKHLRLLVKRGLVVCGPPGLRLMDESFRRFIISASRDQDVEGWRQQEGGSAWELMKAPLMLILVSVALFLFITQKDIYDSTISFMSAIAAGLAALFRLLGMFQGKDKGAGAIKI
jgi:hypothetical protein